jgi:membrane protein YqaA with SNARE-associated domain
MIDFAPDAGLWGLFASAFVSATILPGNSEIVLVAVLAKFPQLFWEAILVATIGNTLGGMTSYLIGRIVPNRAEGKALAWLKRYGEWVLLLSWVPLIGDALCVAAGWLRINPWLALLMLAIGKCARYLVLALGWTMLGPDALA